MDDFAGTNVLVEVGYNMSFWEQAPIDYRRFVTVFDQFRFPPSGFGEGRFGLYLAASVAGEQIGLRQLGRVPDDATYLRIREASALAFTPAVNRVPLVRVPFFARFTDGS